MNQNILEKKTMSQPKSKYEDRHLELSAKFIEMGQALMKEGQELNDYSIAQLGGIVIVLSSLLYDEQDMHDFTLLTTMYSAKKMLEGMDYVEPPDTYEGLIKKINDMRNNNKKGPTE